MDPFDLLCRGAVKRRRISPAVEKIGNDDDDSIEEVTKFLRIVDNELIGLKERELKALNLKPFSKFKDLNLKNIEQVTTYYTTPTPVQRVAIPLALTGKSFICQAPTGSGKTLAFLLPIIRYLEQQRNDEHQPPTTLILAPTRELVIQIQNVWKRIYKDSSLKLKTMANGSLTKSDIVVSTANLTKWISGGSLVDFLKGIEIIVIDEMDEMLDLTFGSMVDEILRMASPTLKQTLMFSATLPTRVLETVSSILPQALVLRVGEKPPNTISQEFIFVTDESGKLSALKNMIQEGELEAPALIFVQSKTRAAQLLKLLQHTMSKRKDRATGEVVGMLQNDMPMHQRVAVLNKFRLGEIWILVCTDLLGRGIDCATVNTVINYDLPSSRETYIHRIGRTGRNGSKGRALTFYTLEELPILYPLTAVLKESGYEITGLLKELQKPNISASKRRFLFVKKGPKVGVNNTTKEKRTKNFNQKSKSKGGEVIKKVYKA